MTGDDETHLTADDINADGQFADSAGFHRKFVEGAGDGGDVRENVGVVGKQHNVHVLEKKN